MTTFKFDDRVEVISHDQWDGSIFKGLKGHITFMPNRSLNEGYYSYWPWVELDKLPDGFPHNHGKTLMFNPLALRKLDG